MANTSPSVVNVKNLNVFDFPSAINKIIDGKKITKQEWGNKDIYGILSGGFLMIHNQNKLSQWIISDGDLMGNDWEVVE
jgi:hypothetical protein